MSKREDYSGGIFDSLAVNIGGVQQWINIRGKNKDAPIMLVVHGGPGSTLMGMSHLYQRPWEEYYTVVNWDQRCSGKTASVSGTVLAEEITLERMLQDALEVVDYLRNRFNRQRIILLGHSWGTMLGALLAKKYPDRFIAYISTGTMVGCRYEYTVVLEQMEKIFTERKDNEALLQIEALKPGLKEEKGNWDWMLAVNKLEIKAGYSSTKVTGAWSAIKYEVLPLLTSPDYTLRDALNLFGYKAYIPLVEKEMFPFDVTELGYEYEMPVYYINGDTDWQTPYILSKDFAAKTIAPDTAFYTLKNCAHCWDVDAPEQITQVICGDVCTRLKKYL